MEPPVPSEKFPELGAKAATFSKEGRVVRPPRHRLSMQSALADGLTRMWLPGSKLGVEAVVS